jgi:hypothetical protein
MLDTDSVSQYEQLVYLEIYVKRLHIGTCRYEIFQTALIHSTAHENSNQRDHSADDLLIGNRPFIR